MSVYFPPIENVSIFDPLLFSIANPDNNEEYLTKDIADNLYLHFPVGQGTETIPSLQITNNANINQNLILDGTYLTNYLEFPDGTKQYTAPSSQQFQPKFVNYSNYQAGTTGYSQGPIITFTGTFGRLDWAMFRICQQASFNNGSGSWANYASTTGTLICRPDPDYMPNGDWTTPISNSIKYVNNPSPFMNPTGCAMYYSNSVNQGNTDFFRIYGNSRTIQFLFFNSGTTGWSTTIEIEYICRSVAGGNVVFSNGSGTNNSLP